MAALGGRSDLDPQWAAESHLVRILSVTGTIHVLALIFVGLRLYARIAILKTPGHDDFVMVASAFCAFGGMLCFILQGYYGLGRHTKTLSTEDVKEFEHIAFFQGIVSATGALGLLKISIAFSLLRLSKNKWYSRALWALVGFVIFYSVLAWLLFLLRCRPISGWWDSSVKATCYSINVFIETGLANTAFNVFTDVCFASLPIPIIWGLQLSKKKRMYLVIVLSLGYLAVAMGIVKAVYQIAFSKDPDKHFNQNIQFWGFLQLNVGIIAACAPTLRPFVRKRLPMSSYHDHYDNLERSGKSATHSKSRLRMSATTRKGVGSNDETYEMHSREPSSQERRYPMIIGGKSDAYQNESAGHGSMGSEEAIMTSRYGGPKDIVCTTEVVIKS